MLELDAIHDFIERSRAENDPIVLADHFAAVVKTYGFTEFVAVSLVNNPTERPPDAVWINRYDPDWTANYLENRYNEIDPFFIGGQSQRLPFVWADFLRDRRLSPEQKRLFSEAEVFGHGFGLTVPIWSYGTYPGCVSLTSDRPFHPGAVHTVHLLSIYFFEALRRVAERDRSDREISLTPREAECLRWAGLGKTVWEVGMILGISEVTARFHLQNARRKYGVSTTKHAFIEALRLNHVKV